MLEHTTYKKRLGEPDSFSLEKVKWEERVIENTERGFQETYSKSIKDKIHKLQQGKF